MATLISEGGITNPDTYLDNYFSNGIAYAAYHAAASKTSARAVKAGIELLTYECGHHMSYTGLSSDPDHKLMVQRLMAYLDSVAGQHMYENYFARVFQANDYRLFNHYACAGKYSA